jgi:hypothetical protein
MTSTTYDRHGAREHRDRHAESLFGSLGKTVDRQGAVLGDALRAIGGRLPKPSLSRASACGKPKRKPCPPTYRGAVSRVIETANKTVVEVRLRNRSNALRTYALSVSAMKGEGGEAGGATTVTPAQVVLHPQETALIKVQVDATKHVVGRTYSAFLDFRAEKCEPQTLAVTVTVRPAVPEEPPVVDLHCCCCPPVRSLDWRHHFYCDPTQPSDSPYHQHDA